MAVSNSCILLLTNAATALAQTVSVFRPLGYNDLLSLAVGRGPDPIDTELHLAKLGAETSPACSGTNDILTVTFPAPITGPVTPEDFEVRVCLLPDQAEEQRRQQESPPGTLFPTVDPDCEDRTPSCVAFHPGDEQNEHRAVLLYGSFASVAGGSAQRLSRSLGRILVKSVSGVMNGALVDTYAQYDKGHGFGWCESCMPLLPSLDATH